MIYIINAFAEFQDLISNTSQTTTPGGELSPLARAYTRDLRTYTDAAVYPGTYLQVFSCTANNVEVAPPVAGITKALEVAHRIASDYQGGSTGRDFLETEFPDIYSVTVEADVPVAPKTLMEKVEYNYDSGGDTYLVKLYMSTSYFEENYDLFEIAVVPPIYPITELQDSYNNVLAKLDAVDPTDISALETDTINGTPASHRRVYKLRWRDADDNTINTLWTILGWGVESMRTDNILEAIQKYLTTQSGQSIETWKNYLPDIQVEDNFTFIPLWDQVAVSAGPGIDVYYRPVMRVGEIPTIGAENFSTRSQAEWEEAGEVLTLLKKSLPMLVIGGLGNSGEERLFSTMYPDYTIFNTNDGVAGHVGAITVTAIQALETLAMLAESYSGTTVLPGNITRNVINNKTFLETAVDGMLFKMLVRSDYVRP